MGNNVYRYLIYNKEVSLTVIDATKYCKDALRIHAVKKEYHSAFLKTLMFTGFLGASLKEQSGKVSVSLRGDGRIFSINTSGNYALQIRGYMDENPSCGKETVILKDTYATLSVIREDGSQKQFVGVTEITGEDEEEVFEKYFSDSEQLPTYFSCIVDETDEKLNFAGLVVLQPLPFASEQSLQKARDKSVSKKALSCLKDGLDSFLKYYPDALEESEKTMQYKCTCSKKYLSGVLSSIPKTELKQMLLEQGEIKVHCHYCNKDYRFTEKDLELEL